jgi:fibro-slime domain-containing protein
MTVQHFEETRRDSMLKALSTMKDLPTKKIHVTLVVAKHARSSLPRWPSSLSYKPITASTLTFLIAASAFGVDACSPADGPDKGAQGSGGATGTGGGGDIDLPDNLGGSGDDVDLIDKPAPDNCGDGVLQADEACDDGNRVNGDGCYGNCLAPEPGFICRTPGELCVPFAKCGDGVVSFPESCDDGNTTSGDGCSDNCKEEIGFRCGGEPSSCTVTVCGDGLKEGAEACEHHPSTLVDGQPMPFGGCTVDTCQVEPDCSGSSCVSRCGDGLRMNAEECDDGNTTGGDGCSATCEVEEGYECTTAPCEIYDPDGDGEGPCILSVPIIYRDFNLSFTDMYNEGDGACPATTGLVNTQLTAGKPTASGVGVPGCFHSAGSFAKWYTHSPPDNSTIVGQLLLFDDESGGFVNRYGNNGDGLTPEKYNGLDGNPKFFPLDGHPLALTDTRHPAAIPPEPYGGNWGQTSGSHNFHFTSEVLYWFTYTTSMDATLKFIGDDDVWVFVNNRLAVDLGGTHVPEEGSVRLANGNVYTHDLRNADETPTQHTALSFGLENEGVYQIRVFQAERKQVGSSFKLTLAGFNASRSDCRSQCGDGIIGAGEECDDGEEENVGGHNRCNPDCTLGGYCGDGVVQESEDCDDGDPEKPMGCSGCRILVVR